MVTILFSEKDLNINNNRNLNNKIFFKTSTGRGSGFDIAKILFFKYKKLLQLNRNHIKTELEHKTVLKKLKELSEKKMGVEYNVKSRHAAF